MLKSTSFLIAMLTVVAPARPQAPLPNPAAQKELKASEFATHAWEGNMAEVVLGQLAEKKACNSEVKNFAKRMVAD
ncbi:MAG: DUF4142 domain-containing protein, partial [Acidobacteria bacterium]|nr:DUF4142 domain-containing protein [Acidobacteriota bacterium]